MLQVIDRAIAGPEPSPEDLFRAVIRKANKPVCTKEELAEVHRFQAEYEAAAKQRDAHTRIAAKAAWTEHQRGLKDAIRKGTASKLDGWTIKDLEEDFFQKMEAAKSALFEITAEFIPFGQKIAARLKAFCDEQANEIEARNATEYKPYGLSPEPSPLAARLRDAGRKAMQVGNQAPKTTMPYLF